MKASCLLLFAIAERGEKLLSVWLTAQMWPLLNTHTHTLRRNKAYPILVTNHATDMHLQAAAGG